VNWLSPVKVRRMLIAGTKKMVLYDDMENVEKVRVFDKGIDVNTREAEYQMLVNYRSGEMYSPVLDNTEALKALLQEFIDAIQENRQPLTSGQDGLEVVRILEATQVSIKNDSKKINL
jgi:predicted dehydrogenase